MDTINPNATPEEQAAQEREFARQENVRREMARTSQDSILVANPPVLTIKIGDKDTMQLRLTEDYILEWDGFKHLVKAGSTRTLLRYLALKYVREFKDKVINQMATNKFMQLMQERSKKGMAELTPFERQEIWNRTYNTNDPNLIAQIYPQLWLGVVEEYGLDAQADDASQLRDFRSDEQKILDSLSKKRVSVPTESQNVAVEASQDLVHTKEKAMAGVAA